MMWVLVKGPGADGIFGGTGFTIESEADIVRESDGSLRINSINARHGQPRITVFAKGAWTRYTTGETPKESNDV